MVDFARALEARWYSVNPVSLLLLPLAGLFCLVAMTRRALYVRGLLPVTALPVPVIVVGNITVGGSGKSPLVLWLVEHLRSMGYRPGIVARGYGGASRHWPRRVAADSDPREVGDEPVLLVRRSGCPCWVGPDRPAAARRLLAESDCDILVSDDGLQHYPLHRDIEIAVIDGERRLGNGFCLPAGPLRETEGRLREANLVVANGTPGPGEHGMRLVPGEAVNLGVPGRRRPLGTFPAEAGVDAVAGIGHPERFFRMLEGAGVEVRRHPFPDHHGFTAVDIDLPGDGPVLMTEKDAVKCSRFAGARHWCVPVEAVMEPSFARELDKLLGGVRVG